jgi:hypothetical protein
MFFRRMGVPLTIFKYQLNINSKSYYQFNFISNFVSGLVILEVYGFYKKLVVPKLCCALSKCSLI